MPFAGHVAHQQADAAVGEREEIVIIAADGAAGGGFAGDVQAGDGGRVAGQQAVLDQRGLLHVLGHGALGFLDFA